MLRIHVLEDVPTAGTVTPSNGLSGARPIHIGERCVDGHLWCPAVLTRSLLLGWCVFKALGKGGITSMNRESPTRRCSGRIRTQSQSVLRNISLRTMPCCLASENTVWPLYTASRARGRCWEVIRSRRVMDPLLQASQCRSRRTQRGGSRLASINADTRSMTSSLCNRRQVVGADW